MSGHAWQRLALRLVRPVRGTISGSELLDEDERHTAVQPDIRNGPLNPFLSYSN